MNLLEQYRENEEINNHTENLLLLVQAYGTQEEVDTVEGWLQELNRKGYVEAGYQDYELKQKINGYYAKLKLDAKEEPTLCTRCNEKLKPEKVVWLELNSRTSEWRKPTEGEEDWGLDSQGGFPFGSACARQQLKKS